MHTPHSRSLDTRSATRREPHFPLPAAASSLEVPPFRYCQRPGICCINETVKSPRIFAAACLAALFACALAQAGEPTPMLERAKTLIAALESADRAQDVKRAEEIAREILKLPMEPTEDLVGAYGISDPQSRRESLKKIKEQLAAGK